MKTKSLTLVLAVLTTSVKFSIAQSEDLIGERLPVPPQPDLLIAAPAGQFFSQREVRLAASKDQLRQAEWAAASSQRAIQIAQAKAGEPDRALTIRKRLADVARPGSAGRVLIIPKAASNAKDLTEVEADLNVMAHILDKAVRSDKSARAMGIPVFGWIPGGSAVPQNLYIEDYGALFFLNVNYSLLPPPDKSSEVDTKEKLPSEWEQARREMARPSPAGGADALATYGESFEREFLWSGGAPAPYDADKVEELKKSLISALKNAANIRKLNTDETVTVVVTGPGGTRRFIKNGGSGPRQSQDEEVKISELNPGAREPASTSVNLVMRVRKADAEAFQNGKLDLDEFRKKVTTMLY
jgi:hypothetical protein